MYHPCLQPLLTVTGSCSPLTDEPPSGGGRGGVGAGYPRDGGSPAPFSIVHRICGKTRNPSNTKAKACRLHLPFLLSSRKGTLHFALLIQPAQGTQKHPAPCSRPAPFRTEPLCSHSHRLVWRRGRSVSPSQNSSPLNVKRAPSGCSSRLHSRAAPSSSPAFCSDGLEGSEVTPGL